LTDRSIASEEKRRLILDAAVRVFAGKGYHTSRVGDIAEEAGVAHGLLYHYFASKEELLETVFRETWSELLEAFARVEESDEPASEQLRQVAAILLRSWRRDPDLVRVLVREVGRSQTLPSRVEEIQQVFRAIERIVERGQASGELRGDLEPRLASWIVYGAIEEILTGWVLGQLDDADEEVAAAERAVVAVVVGGLAVSGTAASRRG
jgi:AcrR family transcriptional regulator